MPPVLLLRRELNGVQRHHDGLTAVALADDFNAVGGMLAGGEVNGKPAANPSPAGFFAVPLNATARPGQLLSVVQAAAGADDAVGKVSAGAFKDVTGGQRVQRLWY